MTEESKPYTWTLLLIVSFVVAIVSASYIGYWLGTREEQPSSKDVLTPAWINYTDPKLGFSMMYPANWSSEITKEGYLIFKGPATPNRGQRPNIIVQAMLPAKFGGRYSNADDAAFDSFDQLKNYDNYTLISYQQTTICNEPAREIVCSYSHNGLHIKQSLVFFQDPEGYIYMICYTAIEGSYSEYIEAYEKAKGTFILAR